MKNTDLFVISDLHLSAVCHPETRQVIVKEGFQDDEVFAHFIDHLIFQSGRNSRKIRLLLLGDFLDFFHTDIDGRAIEGYIPSTAEDYTHRKLDAIFSGHDHFFRAFHRFLSHGFSIDIVPGNHDVELLRTSTQKYFSQALSRNFGPFDSAHLSFYPWIYYIPGVLYAEHGHLYHDLNAPARLLFPFEDQQGEELALPLGAHYDLYRSKVLAAASGSIPGDLNVSGSLFSYYLRYPRRFFIEAPITFHFVKNVLSLFTRRMLPGYRRLRSCYRSKQIAAYAETVDLPYELLLSLDDLAALSYRRMFYRLLGKFLNRNLPQTSARDICSAAEKIDFLLSAHQLAVPYYVFGHSHYPIKLPLNAGRGGFYLNPGTWSSPVHPGDGIKNSQLPFVHIAVGANRMQRHGNLMRWVDSQLCIEPYSYNLHNIC